MAAPLATRFICPHGGQIGTIPLANVRAGGMPAMAAREAPISGCAAPNPCIRVVFPTGSMRARSHGESLLTTESVGQCFAVDGQPGGLAVAIETQPLVTAS